MTTRSPDTRGARDRRRPFPRLLGLSENVSQKLHEDGLFTKGEASIGKKNEISFGSMSFSNFRGTEYFVNGSSLSDLRDIRRGEWRISGQMEYAGECFM